MDRDEIVKCYCSKCKQHTKHIVLASHTEGSEMDDDYFWRQYYRMVQCCGCGHVSFDVETIEESNVEYDIRDGTENYVPSHISYPDKEGEIELIENSWGFPSDVYGIYRESVRSLNIECYRLAAAGFRATIEAVCIDKNIQFKNLEAKINGLKKAGIITEADRNRLHSIRFLGNDAVHQIQMPTRESLMIVLDIINGILTNLYILDDKMKNTLVCPINTIEEFISLLNDGLKSRVVGEIDILKNLLPENRRLIKDDRAKFEEALRDRINNGTYTKLSLCPAPTQGRNQQYKIESI